MAAMVPALVMVLFGLLLTVLLEAGWWPAGAWSAGLAPALPPEGSAAWAEPETPQGILLQQLLRIDAAREPVAASALHAALARLHDVAGQLEEAIYHYEAARDYAATAVETAPPPLRLGEAIVWAGKERVELAEARLALARAYTSRGRAADAGAELDKLHSSLVGLEDLHMAAVLHAMGHAKRDLGRLDSALRFYKLAKERVEQTAYTDPAASEEYVGLLGDIGEVHARSGRPSEALDLVQQALDLLRAPVGVGPGPGGDEAELLKPDIASRLRFILGETLHALDDGHRASVQYSRALWLERRSPHPRALHIARINEGADRAKQGLGPALPSVHRRPRPTRSAVERRLKDALAGSAPPAAGCREDSAGGPDRGAASFCGASRAAPGTKREVLVKEASAPPIEETLEVRVRRLLNGGQAQVKQAEVECLAAVEASSSGGLGGAAARVLLGRVYRRQQRISEASKQYSEALAIVLNADSAGSREADEAYKGLSVIQVYLHSLGQSAAAEAIFRDAVALADAAGIPREHPGRRSGEVGLRANAFPSVVMPNYSSTAPAPEHGRAKEMR